MNYIYSATTKFGWGVIVNLFGFWGVFCFVLEIIFLLFYNVVSENLSTEVTTANEIGYDSGVTEDFEINVFSVRDKIELLPFFQNFLSPPFRYDQYMV